MEERRKEGREEAGKDKDEEETKTKARKATDEAEERRETADSELAEAPTPTVRDEIDADKTLRPYLYLIITNLI